MSGLLWATALVGIGAGVYLGWRAATKRDLSDVFFAVGFIILGILAALLATMGYEALQLPAAPILGALVPLLTSLGVFYVVFPKFWKYYAIFVVVGVVAIAVVRQAVMAFHPVAGLVLLILPIYAVVKKRAPALFVLVSIGALLIGIGGVALATIVAGRPLLPPELVLSILPAVLLGTAIFLAGGAILGKK